MPRKRQNNFSNVGSPHPMLLPTPACTLSLASSWDLCLVQDRVWLAVPPLCHPWQLHVSHAACAANPLTRRREEGSAGLSLSVTSVWLDLPCGSYDYKMSFSNNHQETLKKKRFITSRTRNYHCIPGATLRGCGVGRGENEPAVLL